MKSRIGWTLALPAVVLLLACACSGDKDETDPAITTPGTATSTSPAITTSIVPSPAPTVLPQQVTKAFWLVDAEAGSVQTLLEDREEADCAGGFDAAGEHVYVWSQEADLQIGFDLAGDEVSRGKAPELAQLCEPGAPVIVDGRTESTPRCKDQADWAPYPTPGAPRQYYIYDRPSPDGLWYVYQQGTELPTQTPNSGASYDLWAVNLQTGERWDIYDGLYHCGGCDGDEETGWSPSGRYYVHVERGPQRRVVLVDFAAHTATDITWPGEYGFTLTRWSPTANVLLRTAGPDAIAIADLDAGTERVMQGLTGGGGFDASGLYVYTNDAEDETLAVVEVATGTIMQRFDGELEGTDGAPIAGTPLGVVAVMGWHRGEACQGTSVRLDAAEVACVDGGEWAAISPDGSTVAVAQIAGGFNGARSSQPVDYDIVLVDVASGSQTLVAQGARGEYPPRLSWNASSTHLLVEWPLHRGL